MDKLLTPDEIKTDEGGCIYKFVKLASGEWRFWKGGTSWCSAHSDMVKEGEKAVAAGALGYGFTHFNLVQSYSSTLGVAIGEADAEELQKLLGLPLNNNYGSRMFPKEDKC